MPLVSHAYAGPTHGCSISRTHGNPHAPPIDARHRCITVIHDDILVAVAGFATFIWNNCNICLKQLKHTSETPENTWKSHCKHMQHTYLLLQHADETLATYVWNIWNTWKHTFATGMLCNICNIQMKHLRHMSETLEMQACNMRILSLQHMQDARSAFEASHYWKLEYFCGWWIFLCVFFGTHRKIVIFLSVPKYTDRKIRKLTE